MSCASLTPSTIKRCDLRWAYAPITSLLAWDDMKMEVRCLLAAVHAVVLKREYAKRLEGLCKGIGNPFGGARNRAAFFIRKIEQQGNVTACDHAALTGFELPRVDDGECKVTFINDCPFFRSPRHAFTKIAGVFYRKFDQLGPRSCSHARFKILVAHMCLETTCSTLNVNVALDCYSTFGVR